MSLAPTARRSCCCSPCCIVRRRRARTPSRAATGRDADYNSEATEQLTCTYEGEPLKIAFNAKFLQEMLSALNAETITMKFSEPNRAAIMLPSEEEANEETLMLVMPVMVHY